MYFTMPESRDRISRPVDYAALLARSLTGPVYQDHPELDAGLFGSPGRVAAARGSTVQGRGGLGTPRVQTGRGRNTLRPLVGTGRENILPSGSARRGRGNGRVRGRASGTVLPSWYPRTPLRDITAIVRTIERRRERLGGRDGQEMASPIPTNLRVPDSTVSLPNTHLEHSTRFMTPGPTLGFKRCPPSVGKLPKILLDITSQAPGDAESLTPQKKLLDSIDTVEKIVMEELHKLKRTPSAKRAERERRVRTLMSLR